MKENKYEELRQLDIPGLTVMFDSDLTKCTTMRMECRAAAHVVASNPVALRELVKMAKRNSWELPMIGKGANMVFASSFFDGVVCSLGGEFKSLDIVGENLVRVGAGVNLANLMRFSWENDLMGLEFLTKVPGQVGGSLAGNAGAGGWGLCDFVERVYLMTREGYVFAVGRNQFRYGYRFSELRDTIVLAADLRLERLDERERRRRVEEYDSKKKNQPLMKRSAGCVFKNPKNPSTGTPVSAGLLIDKAGLKGYRIRNAKVSDEHANFIINEGKTNGENLMALINLIQDIIYERNEIMLDLEVQILGGPLSSVITH